jgi:hypothetical protein
MFLVVEDYPGVPTYPQVSGRYNYSGSLYGHPCFSAESFSGRISCYEGVWLLQNLETYPNPTWLIYSRDHSNGADWDPDNGLYEGQLWPHSGSGAAGVALISIGADPLPPCQPIIVRCRPTKRHSSARTRMAMRRPWIDMWLAIGTGVNPSDCLGLYRDIGDYPTAQEFVAGAPGSAGHRSLHSVAFPQVVVATYWISWTEGWGFNAYILEWWSGEGILCIWVGPSELSTTSPNVFVPAAIEGNVATGIVILIPAGGALPAGATRHQPAVIECRPTSRRSTARCHVTQLLTIEAATPWTRLPTVTRCDPTVGHRLAPRSAVTSVPRFSDVHQRCWLDLRGLYRIFNPPEYRFYRSNVGPPAEGSEPFATSEALPETPADTFADGTWYLSVSYFNGVLDSGFLPLGPRGETYIVLTITDGEANADPPLPPLNWRLEAGEGGVVRIVGVYVEDGPNRADQWAIAYTTDGTDPPIDDAAIAVTVTESGLAFLGSELPAVADGTTVKVRLQMRRDDGDEGAVWVYSADSIVLAITVDALGPTAALAAERWPGRLPAPEGAQ